MTVKCYNKPNRTRVRTFTAKDVGRIACAAIEDGVSEADIITALEECINFDDKKACEETKQKLDDAKFENELLIAAVILAIPLFRILKKAASVFKIFLNKKQIDRINKEYEDLIRRLREANENLPVEVQI